MDKLLEGLISYFEDTPREQILKDWAESEEKYRDIGPTVEEFLENSYLYSEDNYSLNNSQESEDFFGFFLFLS